MISSNNKFQKIPDSNTGMEIEQKRESDRVKIEELKKRIVQKIPVFLRKYLQTVVRRVCQKLPECVNERLMPIRDRITEVLKE